MGYYIGKGGYYEGDRQGSEDVEVPQRPSIYHFFIDNAWIFSRVEWLNEYVRPLRNKLLLDCDWTQLPDAKLSEEKKAQWVAYRQNLRDITKTATPDVFAFPDTP